MSASALSERPPTPPRSNDGDSGALEVQSHFQPTEPYTPPRSILPAPKVEDTIVSDSEAPEAQPNSQRQDPYGDPSLYQTAAPVNTFYPIQPVSALPQTSGDKALLTPSHQTFMRTTLLQTPPPADDDEDRIRTRSGRALGSPSSPVFRNSSRVTKSPRIKSTPKASKKSKAAQTDAPLLDQPLSILTKDYKIPVKDMEAWVHRPVSERLQQANKNKGQHISRPMNSFMLYRSAYADRAKHFCQENNHQVVSKVTGASWPLEPKEVREMYEEFARIERDAHQNAHPDYKFAPNKSGAKKRPHFEDDDDDDDPEWYGSRQGKRSRTGTAGPNRSHSSTPFDDRFQTPYQPAMNPSSYWATNGGRPPVGMGHESYYQPVVQQYNQHVDDVVMRRIQYPQYEQPQLIGLPNNNHPALLDGQYHGQTTRDVLDPQLAGGEPQYQYTHYETVNPGYEAPRSHQYGAYAIAPQQFYEEQPQAVHPGMATLTDGQHVWEVSGEPGSELDDAFAFRNWT